MKYIIVTILCILSTACIEEIGNSVKYEIGEPVYIKTLHVNGKLLETKYIQDLRYNSLKAIVEVEYIDTITKEQKSKIETVFLYEIEKVNKPESK